MTRIAIIGAVCAFAIILLVVGGSSLTLSIQPEQGTVGEENISSESATAEGGKNTEEAAGALGVESGASSLAENSGEVGVEGSTQPILSQSTPYLILKDVGEPDLDRFGLAPADFRSIKAAGVDMIAVNFDICASGPDVLRFLDSAGDVGLKVIMPAGSGEAEWGYPCDGEFSSTLKPNWQKAAVQEWVEKWAYHPAIFAWDISNEAGQNFPNAQKREETWIQEGYAVTVSQLQQAYKDVKAADPTRPVMVRMNGWFFYDYDSNFFRAGNPFGQHVADIVMVNAYSNVGEYFDDFVETVSARTQNAVHAVNSEAQIIVAVGAWEEAPLWFLPSPAHFTHDVDVAKKTKDLLGVAVFKYGAEESEWWMPRDAKTLWGVLPALHL